MAQPTTTHGAKDQKATGSAERAAGSNHRPSRPTAGRVTRKGQSSGEALDILRDALLMCDRAGVEVRYVDNYTTQDGHPAVAFILVNVKRSGGILLPESPVTSLPENQEALPESEAE